MIWQKEFNIQFVKLGQILINAGLINNQELVDVLNIQKEETQQTGRKRPIGEVISETFSISIDIIENLFIREQIISAILDAFKAALAQDVLLECRLEKESVKLDTLIEVIELKISSWKTVKSFYFNDNGQSIEKKAVIENVSATMQFHIKLNKGLVIDKYLDFKYENSKQKIYIDMPHILGAVRMELVKAVAGRKIMTSPSLDIDYSEVLLEIESLSS